jgi:hypothetical protein
LRHSHSQDFALILDSLRRYKLIRLDHPRKLIGCLPWNRREYQLDGRHRWPLVGWHPGTKEGFFSDLTMRDRIPRMMSIFPHASNPSTGPIKSLDRLVDELRADALTPQIHRAYFMSPLYRERMRKLKIGGMDIRILFVAFAILGIILALLYFSGYLGG